MTTKTPDPVTALFERVGNHGYLRFESAEFRPEPDDPMLPSQMVRELGLRGGEVLEGLVQSVGQRQGGIQEIVEIASVDGMAPAERAQIPAFSDRTPISPHRSMRLSSSGGPIAMRLIDIFCPIGFGQRGLIIAPPRTGKTILLQQIAHAIAANHPETEIFVLLVDERPEEVTDMKRNVPGRVVASSNDLDASNHVRVAEFTIERARRVVETGKDVVVLLDSLTRLGRAYNQEVRETGRVLSGGLESRALEKPKSVFGAARCFEEGGSLTIIASLLVDTGSHLDEVICTEFRGTANMEVVLSSELANHRIWPAIDVQQSGTRKEESLLTESEIKAGKYLRKKLDRKPLTKGTPNILKAIKKHDTHEEMVATLG